MKKIGLLSFATLGLATGFYTQPVNAASKSELKSVYNTTMNQEAKAINAYVDYYEDKKTETEASTAMNNAYKKVDSQKKKLDSTSNKELTSKMKKLVSSSASTIKALHDNDESFYSKETKEAKQSQAIRKKLKISAPKSANEATDRLYKMAQSQPHVTKDSVVTPEYTIKFTKQGSTTDYRGGNDIVLYYTFTNNSEETIEPEQTVMFNGAFKQESDTSIVTLSTGISNDSSFNDLLGASQQEVKSGASVECAIDYQMDNDKYPVKYVAKTEDGSKIGTINLSKLPQQ